MQSSKLFWIAQKFLGTVLGTYIILCIVLFFFQTRFIFFPNRNLYTVPISFKLPSQEVWIPVKTASGKIERVHGWWIQNPNPKAGTILHFHGNGGGMARVDQLYKLGFSILLVSYRGYAQSEGNFPSEAQIYEDAEAAWNYLTNDKRIPANQIVIYGLSLGGAVAIDLAVKHPEAKALIVQSTFTSMNEMGRRNSLFKFFPVDLILTQRFNSIEKIKKLKIPAFFIHGKMDSLVPFSMAQALYEATPTEKKIVFIPDGEHNDVNLSPDHLSAIAEFIKRIQN